MSRIDPQILTGFAEALLRAGGYSPAFAAKTAEVLVWANLRGTESHGVLRIPRYLEMVAQGTIDPVAEPEVVSRSGAIALLDAKRAPGIAAMDQAMDLSIEAAQGFGIGCCVARSITHAGAVGYYAAKAAGQGMLGIVMTASGPLMAYHGAASSGVSTNPISIAAPRAGDPLLLDMSTSAVALGKVLQARDAGTEVPLGWGLDASGAPTTDANAVKTLLPMAGAKGSGLSLMIEVLCSLLASNPVIAPALKGEKVGMNGIAIAIDIARFTDPAEFTAQIEALAAALKTLPQVDENRPILMPGERGFACATERTAEGVPLAQGTCRKLAAVAETHNVTLPEGLTAPA